MRSLIIGHSVVDLFNVDDKVIEKPGGIFYAVTGISLCRQKDDSIYLLSSMEEGKSELFKNIFKNVDQRYIEKSSAIPRVNLTLCKTNERGEKYSNINAKLDVDRIPDFNMFDGILINMISGFDINLEDLKSIRKKYEGLIYLDIHTLSRGLDKDNNRKFRKVPEASQWLNSVDIVQVNEKELLTIASGESELIMAKEVLSYRPHLLLITMGNKGVKMFFKENEEVKSRYIPAITIDSINQIGCGDVFGAVFFYSYISNNDRDKSLITANIAAGVMTAYDEFNNLERIRNDFLERLD